MKITFSGDICASRNVKEFSLSKTFCDVYRNSDFNVACLEAPIIASDLEPYIKIGPSLKQSPEMLLEVIKYFTHVSLANNHTMDYGPQGLSDTIEYLSARGVLGIGAGLSYPDMYLPAILETEGIRVALFCWAEAQYGCCRNAEQGSGYAWMMNPITYGLIQEYKNTCDYVILFVHAGLEDVEFPIIEWREQYRAYIDYGADLVVANHPHAIQGKETYKGKAIYYSLGNFFFNGKYATGTSLWNNSLMLECTLDHSGIAVKEYFAEFDDSGIHDSKPEIATRFNELTALLKPESFDAFKKIHDKMIMNCWNEYYKSYYSFPIWKEKERVVFFRRWFNNIMRGYAHRCFLPPVTENKIYHNINIETHRFVVSRVCSMIAGTY